MVEETNKKNQELKETILFHKEIEQVLTAQIAELNLKIEN
jgi:hypothetical protein